MSKKENETKPKKKGNVGKFILGALVGAGLGVLFAPKAGSETRKELKEKMADLLEKAKSIDVEEVKTSIADKVEEIKQELNDLDKEKVLKIAKEKGIYPYFHQLNSRPFAKKKGTPILENAANEVRSKAIDTVKDILDRLEESDKKSKSKK